MARERWHTSILRAGCLVTCLLIVNRQSSIANPEPPDIWQPAEHFYKAQGSRVKVAWTLDRTSVPEDEELVATLTVKGATNPQEIVRPDLKKLEAFESRFVITDNRDPPPAAGAPEVRFSYRLRPRNRQVTAVPTLKFAYYDRSAPEGKQYQTTQAKFVSITVTPPRPKPPPPAIPLNEPDHLFAVASGPRVLEARPFVPGDWAWPAVALGGPLAALGWYVAWRRVFPDAARLTRLRRTRAARRAIDAARRSGHAADPPGTIAGAVLAYLRARFPLPPGAVTPTEVGAALAELGLPAEECESVADFLRACDAARFAPPGETDPSLAASAEALVVRLEAA